MDDRPDPAADGIADGDVAGEAISGEAGAVTLRDTDAEDAAAKLGPKTFVSGTTPSLSHVRAPTIVIRRKRNVVQGAAHGG
jgi:hypothetical protein